MINPGFVLGYGAYSVDAAAVKQARYVSGFLWAITNFPPLRVLSRGLIGLANVMLPGKGLKQGPFVSQQDIRSMAQVGHEEGVIEEG